MARSPQRIVLFVNSIASMARAGATSVTNLVLPIVLAVLLAPQQFTVWALVWSLAAYTTYIDLGSQSAVAALVGRASGNGRLDEALGAGRTGITLMALVGLVCLAIGGVSASALHVLFPAVPDALASSAGVALVVLVAGQVLNLLCGVASAYFTGRQRGVLVTFVVVPVRLVAAAAAIAVAASGGALPWIAAGFAAPFALGLVLLIVLLAREADDAGVRIRPRRVPMRSVLAFSGSLMFWNLCMLVVTGTDVTIVGRVDYPALAAYSLAWMLVAGLTGLQNAALNPVLPALGRWSAAQKDQEFRSLLLRVSRLNSTTLLLSGAVIVAAGAPLLPLLARTDGDVAARVLVLLVAATVVRIWLAPLSSAFVAAGTHRRIVLPPLGEAAVNLVTSIGFGLLLGATGVALGTLIGAVAGASLTLWHALPRSRPAGLRLRPLLRESGIRPAVVALPAVIGVAVELVLLPTAGPVAAVPAAAGIVVSLGLAVGRGGLAVVRARTLARTAS